MTSHVLHLGDCLDPVSGLASLPDKSVDHVICDPPYSEFTHGKDRGNELGGLHPLTPIGFKAITDEHRSAFACECCRLVRRWTLIWCDIEGVRPWVDAIQRNGLEYVRTGVWVKGNPAPQLSGDRPGTGAETVVIAHALLARKPIRKRWNGGGRVAIWESDVVNSGREARLHETQKPLALMEALVRDFTDAGETILDPFAGSATTMCAAKRLGRNSIGWERDPRYHAIGLKRLEKTHEQMGLWTGAA